MNNKKVVITDPHARLEMSLFELNVSGKAMELEGTLLAVSPTVEELVSLHECFEHVMESPITDEDLEIYYVYFDKGADRPFVIEKEFSEIQEVN